MRREGPGLAVVALVVVFVAGGATGIAVDRDRTGGRDVEDRVITRSRIPAELEALGLSDEQRRQVQDVLDRGGPLADSALRDAIARLRVATASVDERIRAILTPEQRARFDQDRERRSTMIIRRRGDRVDTVRTP
jgi:hypothetical protein